MYEFWYKFKDIVSGINVPMTAFSILALRIVWLGGSYPEAIALIALASLYGFNMHVSGKSNLWKKAIEAEIIDLKTKVSNLNMRDNVRNQYEQGNKKARRLF